MNKLFYYFILILFFFNDSLYALEDKVIAIVNDRVVLQSQLDKKISRLDTSSMNKLQITKVQNDILDVLIEESLLEQAAARMGIIVSDIDLQNQVKLIAKKQNVTVLQLKELIEANDISYATYLNNLRKKISIQELFRTQFTNRAYVSEEEINSYIKNNNSQKTINNKIDIDEYLFEVQGSDIDMNKVNIFFKSVKESGFEESVNKYPDFKVKVATLKDVAINDLPDIYQSNLQILDDQNYSKSFKTGKGYVFLKVLKSDILVDEYKVSHILLQTNPMEDINMIKNKLYEIKKIATKEKSFGEYAKKYSLDKVSAIKNGSLGWINKDKVVKDFSNVMVNTPIGQISEPFKTNFGWHILFVEDKRVKNITEAVLRNQALVILRERKAEVGKKEWLSKLKDQAYIEIIR